MGGEYATWVYPHTRDIAIDNACAAFHAED
jgi:hypothetical protein